MSSLLKFIAGSAVGFIAGACYTTVFLTKIKNIKVDDVPVKIESFDLYYFNPNMCSIKLTTTRDQKQEKD